MLCKKVAFLEGFNFNRKQKPIVTWQHINLQGEYDFSEKSIENSLEFKLQEILEVEVA